MNNIVPNEPWKRDPNFDPKQEKLGVVLIFSGFVTTGFGAGGFGSPKAASYLSGFSPDTCELVGGGLCVIGFLAMLLGASLLPKSKYPGDPGGIIR